MSCPTGESCDPQTGMCASGGGGTSGTLVGSVGQYSGAGACGDDDNQVMLVDVNGMLVLRGFTGNGDIPLTLTEPDTATAMGVVAFGQGDHDMTIVLTSTGEITINLMRAGAACNDTLVTVP